MAQEQTTKGQQPVEAISYDLKGFMDIVQDLKAQRDALKKRTEYLEMRLEQREQETKKDYQSMKTFFDAVKLKILQIFVELPASVGLSHPEIAEEFRQRYPAIRTVDLPRRTRELCKEQKLWSCPDQDGTVRFFLRLKETEETT